MTRRIVLAPEDMPRAHEETANLEHEDKDRTGNEQRIDAGILIPGQGDPIRRGTLIFVPKHGELPSKILFAGPQADIPNRYSKLSPSTSVPVLMPGLWDCHVHFFGFTSLDLDTVAALPPALGGFRSARDLVTLLNAGFTSVREVGGYGVDFSKAIDEGWIPGPHVYSAGAPLSQTAGHGDLHTVPLDQLHLAIDGHAKVPLCLVDGVDSAILAVRKQIRRGAKVIKICSTGGVLSRIDSPRASQFNKSELEVMVEEAARANLQVASHAHGTAGIIAALKAGVKTIEHGSYLTKEAIDLMIEKKAILCATRLIQVAGLEVGKKTMTPISFAKLQEVAQHNADSYAAAIKAGVRCALGTDMGVSNQAAYPLMHGLNGREFQYAVEAGMSPLQAIEAGTATGPYTIGLPLTENPLSPAPLSGQLKEGYDADFIALDDNPLDDIKILGQADKITHVWKDGILYKSPGKLVSIMGI